MKKIIALVLCLLMVAALTACGGQETPEESTANTKQTETTPATEKNQQPEESVKPIETEPAETKPAFDTSWAGAEYVMPIPEPPFTEFSVDKTEGKEKIEYMIFASGDEIGALTQDDVLAYKDALVAAGFTNVDYETEFSEETYWYAAYTEDGATYVAFECHIQRGAIAIVVEQEVANTAPIETETTFDTSWASNRFEALLPELPFTDRTKWTTDQTSDSVYEITIIGLNTSAATNDSDEPDGADKDKLIAYLNSLPAYGFEVTETGEGYQWLVKDSDGNRFEFLCADGGCFITITTAKH